ncbi:hypothetical protein evm_004631 [Chilo suppressalis]|nr:hypothetical protein evm_004631 [Chilo suppressalis]
MCGYAPISTLLPLHIGWGGKVLSTLYVKIRIHWCNVACKELLEWSRGRNSSHSPLERTPGIDARAPSNRTAPVRARNAV